jgi:hypothetical protein
MIAQLGYNVKKLFASFFIRKSNVVPNAPALA